MLSVSYCFLYGYVNILRDSIPLLSAFSWPLIDQTDKAVIWKKKVFDSSLVRYELWRHSKAATERMLNAATCSPGKVRTSFVAAFIFSSFPSPLFPFFSPARPQRVNSLIILRPNEIHRLLLFASLWPSLLVNAN